MTIFFTADTHFGHSKIIDFCSRPFSCIEEMDETLIMKWNAKVKPQDVIYHLGDFAFGSQRYIIDILKQLNGNIHLIKGNHDKGIDSLVKYFTSVRELVTISVDDDSMISGKQTLVLCHYAMLTWQAQHYRSWQLFGHSHGSLPKDKLHKLQLDVGVDCHEYAPISYEEIKILLS